MKSAKEVARGIALELVKIESIYEVSTKKALGLCQKAANLCENAKLKQEKCQVLFWTARCYYRLSDINNALQTLFQILRELKYHRDTDSKAHSLSFIGYLFDLLGEYDSAIEYNVKALRASEKLGNDKAMMKALNVSGITYTKIKEYGKALECHEKSLKLARKLNSNIDIGNNLGNIGNIYVIKKEFNKALKFLTEGLENKRKAGDQKNISIGLLSIASVFLEQEDYVTATKYINESEEIFKDIKYTFGEAVNKMNLAEIKFKQGDSDGASALLKNALKLAEKDNLIEIIFESHEKLYDLYKKENQLKQALFHLERTHEVGQKIQEKSNSEKSRSMLIKYDVEKNEQEKEIFRLKNVELTRLNAIIEQKNRNITDSISYAQRIQEAVLPQKEALSLLIPESFIFYKPRDIVSGDFYWYSTLKNKLLLAAVDCTGHGVPGAFLSIIGNELLNELVEKNKISTPGKILSGLEDGLARVLKKEDRDSLSVDGMDIGLFTIDLEKMKLEYAGAGRPLILIRDKRLEVYKGNKLPIGLMMMENRAFETEIMDIRKGDCLYMFSDGYIDQFGGQNRQKFLSGRFYELLLEIHQKKMVDQEQILQDVFTKWMGSNAQIDDVLVIGLRV